MPLWVCACTDLKYKKVKDVTLNHAVIFMGPHATVHTRFSAEPRSPQDTNVRGFTERVVAKS